MPFSWKKIMCNLTKIQSHLYKRIDSIRFFLVYATMKKDIPYITYSYKDEADLRASEVEIHSTYSTFKLKYENNIYNVSTTNTLKNIKGVPVVNQLNYDPSIMYKYGYIAINNDRQYQVEFYTLTNDEKAVYFYNTNKTIFENTICRAKCKHINKNLLALRFSI